MSSNTVFATCRNPDNASALQSLKQKSVERLYIIKLDVGDEKSTKDAAEAVQGILGERGLDYLLNNAGIVSRTDLVRCMYSDIIRSITENEGYDVAFTMSISSLTKSLHTNVIGPAITAQIFLPLIEKSGRKVIVNTSTIVGSFGKDMGSVVASYSISKAALNMLVSPSDYVLCGNMVIRGVL